MKGVVTERHDACQLPEGTEVARSPQGHVPLHRVLQHDPLRRQFPRQHGLRLGLHRRAIRGSGDAACAKRCPDFRGLSRHPVAAAVDSRHAGGADRPGCAARDGSIAAPDSRLRTPRACAAGLSHRPACVLVVLPRATCGRSSRDHRPRPHVRSTDRSARRQAACEVGPRARPRIDGRPRDRRQRFRRPPAARGRDDPCGARNPRLEQRRRATGDGRRQTRCPPRTEA